MKLLGLIAEDQSDVDVVRELTQKLARSNFRIKRFLGHGCGRIHAKSRAWAEHLQRQGCSLLILISDLDGQRLTKLSATLHAAINPCPIQQHVIVIPVREIEAWLLADHEAITRALNLRRPMKKQPNPEAIQNPKERLRDLIRERSNGRISYLNTVHNEKIAKHVHIENLKRCPSFACFKDFIGTHLV